jgi:hypothetical protein
MKRGAQTMIVENTTGDAQPADGTTQQTGVTDADGISALEQMVVGDEPAADTENTSEVTPDDEADADEADDTADNDDADADEESESDGETKTDAKAHTGQRAEKRIHKLTAQRNEAREKLEATEKALTAAREAANSQVELQADYLKADELALIKKATGLIDRRKFLIKKLGIGYEDDKDPSKSLTAEQVAEELSSIDDFSDEIGNAQRIYRERKQQMLDDMKAGRTLRLSKQALTKNKPAPTVKSTTPSATATRSVASSQTTRRGVSIDRFNKNGGGADAAIRELEELVPG